MHQIIFNEADKINQKIDFSSLRNSTVLITGASGLVGVFLTSCITRIQKEYNIDLYVWINNEVPDYLKPLYEGAKIIKGDITDIHLVSLPMFDFIIHSAGYGQPLKFVRNKIKTIQINTDVTTRLFGSLKPKGSFLFLSSSEVYNGLETPNVNETMMGCTNTDHFRSCYIEGKKCGESICHAFLQEGFNVKIARLSLAYGPGTRIEDERVINTFVKKGILNDSIEMMDHGSAIRTYCYITDAVEMLWNIFLHGKDVTYNVGGTDTTSIIGLAQVVGELTNKPVKLPAIDKPLQGNPLIVNICCSKYKNEFGKEDFVPLKEGAKQVVDWYKLMLSNENYN